MNINKALIAIVLVAITTSCSRTANQSSNSHGHDEHESHSDTISLTSQQIETVGIKIGQMELRDISTDISASGQLCLEATDRADITTLVAGRVRSISVKEGQKVGAGQVVAYIENTQIVEIQQQYLVAYQDEMLARSELSRQKTLNSQGAGVERTLQQAEVRYQTAQTQRRALATSLRQIGISTATAESGNLMTHVPIRTPIAGTVSRINVSLGSYADLQTPLMQIDKNSAIYCRLNVFESNITYVEVGQEVEISLTAHSNSRLKGRVSRINPTIDPTTRALSVIVAIESGSIDNLAPGMYANATIQTGTHRVPTLPDDAIVSNEGKSYVFVALGSSVAGNKSKTHSDSSISQLFKKVEVAASTSSHGYTQVSPLSQALPSDARIVTSGAFYLASMTADHGEH